MEYDKNNKGALWRNETSTQENRQPFMSGKCVVNGQELNVVAWKVEAEGGKKARLDLKFQEPQAREVATESNSSTSLTGDVPF